MSDAPSSTRSGGAFSVSASVETSPRLTWLSRPEISRRALQNLESGHACTVALLIRVLRALDRLDGLDALLPEPGPSPILLARLRGRERQRASGAERRRDRRSR